MSVDLSKIKPGVWIITDSWQGPWAEVSKVTAKRVYLKPRGVIDPAAVRAIHPTMESAMAGHARYRQTLSDGQAELVPLKEAARLARERLDAAIHAIRDRAWAAAQADADV